MTHGKGNLSRYMVFGSLIFLGMTAAMQSLPAVPVSAQNASNLTATTAVDDVGLVTIAPEQINEIKNSINATRLALQQGNTSEALANLSIVEGQFLVLTEET